MGYLLNNQPLDLDDHNLLQRAHLAKIRPICDCTAEGVPVIIHQIGENFYLKRFPETGFRHRVGCKHYSPPEEISGAGELLGEAIVRNDSDNSTVLKVNFSLSKGASAPRATANASPPDTTKSAPKKLSLKSLFDFLWDEAELTSWNPQVKGTRNYDYMRTHLMDAAVGKTIKSEKLGDVLYIPEFYRPENKDRIKIRREMVFSRIAGTKKYMLALGELKTISPSTHGFKLTMKHIPDSGFFMTEKFYEKLKDKFSWEIELAETNTAEKYDPNNPPQSKVIAMLLFSVNGNGYANVIEAYIATVTSDLIPYSYYQELVLINMLKSQHRTFSRCLPYNRHDGNLARLFLRDSEHPTALFIRGSDTDETIEREIKELKPKYDIDAWVWNVSEQDPPPLPKQKVTTP